MILKAAIALAATLPDALEQFRQGETIVEISNTP